MGCTYAAAYAVQAKPMLSLSTMISNITHAVNQSETEAQSTSGVRGKARRQPIPDWLENYASRSDWLDYVVRVFLNQFQRSSNANPKPKYRVYSIDT